MDIPDLVKGALDGEEIQAGVSLGDEDAVCLTPTRTLVYRGEGLLSDEAVEEYSHDIEQLAVSEGRRKTKFTMQYIDGTRSFTVPANRGEKVLELFLEGVLKLDGVIDDRESLAGVYRFSELTLIISEGRLIKHIGSQVWSEDFEVYAYDDVTGLEFERASVATSIALSVGGRPQRVKVPNDKAPVVRQTLEQALFGYYDVANVDELNRVVGPETDTGGVDTASDEGGDDDFAFGDDFDPLVSEEADLTESVDADERLAESDPAGGGQSDPARQPDRDPDPTETTQPDARATDARGGQSEPAAERREARQSEPRRPDAQQSQSQQPDAQQSQSQQPDAQQSQSQQTNAQQSRSQQADAQQTDARQSQSGQTGAAEADAATEPATSTTEPVREPETAADRSTAPESTADAAADGLDDTRATNEADAVGGTDHTDDTAEAEPAPVSREEFEAMAERLDELTDAVDRQNELLKRQHRALKQLVQQRDSE
jgi:hypothetical protein